MALAIDRLDGPSVPRKGQVSVVISIEALQGVG
jgi:hypothetical protein